MGLWPIAFMTLAASLAPNPEVSPDDLFSNVASSCSQTTALPEPAGPHQVGTSTFYFVDQNRPEGGTSNPEDRRQVIVQLWYPGLRDRDSAPVPYAPELEIFRAYFLADSREMPRKIASNLDRYGCVLTHAFKGLPVSDLTEKYPVLVFSPGGNMSRHWHSAQAQEFASRGYVVVMLSHAFSGLDFFPGLPIMAPERWALPKDATAAQEETNDNAMSEELARDARFALDQLAMINSGAIKHALSGRVDMSKVAIAGHSRGGKTVARSCSSDPRFKACVTYDNIAPAKEEETGLKTPQLTIRTPWEPARKQELRAYLQKNPRFAADVEIANTTHFTFTDLQIVDPEHYEHKLDPVRGLKLANDITAKFIGDVFSGKTPILSDFVKSGQVDVWVKNGR